MLSQLTWCLCGVVARHCLNPLLSVCQKTKDCILQKDSNPNSYSSFGHIFISKQNALQLFYIGFLCYFHISAVLLRRTCCFELAGAAELCNAVVVWRPPDHRRQIRPHLSSDSICLSPITERVENSHFYAYFTRKSTKKEN